MNNYIYFWGLNIPSYGLCMTVAFFLCSFLIIKKASSMGILFENTIIIISVAIGMALLCGVLLYILVSYTPEQIMSFLKNRDFSFILNSGIVFYGGLIGGITGALICSRKLNVEIGILETCVVPYIPLGHAIGRVGCLMAGCCHGTEYTGPFAVKNLLLSNTKTYFPIQGVEAVLNLIIMIVLLLYAKRKKYKHDLIILYLYMYSVMRFFVEFLRADIIRGGALMFSTSQWISVFIITICTGFTIKVNMHRGNEEKR